MCSHLSELAATQTTLRNKWFRRKYCQGLPFSIDPTGGKFTYWLWFGTGLFTCERLIFLTCVMVKIFAIIYANHLDSARHTISTKALIFIFLKRKQNPQKFKFWSFPESINEQICELLQIVSLSIGFITCEMRMVNPHHKIMKAHYWQFSTIYCFLY